ncbi:MAG: glycosyltransferase family 4 protein, partial [Gammaproteobacteria bacterium]|nr:glycosyltransferase family 4 protein [Gammaproteobacteria bacterium]
PNGVDIDYFKPDASAIQQRSLIFIGTLNWYPNIEAARFIAHELWPILKNEIAGITIDVIGASPPEDIVKVGNEDNDFNVHGFVDDILPYMNKAAIYICPIMDGGGTKLKILDALAMKKALVAHEIACEGIRIENGKNVLFAQSVSEYVVAIKKLIGDDGLRKKMGNEARRLIENEYSYEIIGKKLSDLYNQCLSSQSAKTDRSA